MTIRPTSDHERIALKAVTRRALQMAGGPDSFSQATRVKTAALSKYGAGQEEASFLPIDVALDLDRDIGTPVVTEALASALGYRLVAKGDGADKTLCYRDIRAVSREMHELVDAAMLAQEDGDVSPEELRSILKEGEDAIQAIRRMMECAIASVKGGDR